MPKARPRTLGAFRRMEFDRDKQLVTVYFDTDDGLDSATLDKAAAAAVLASPVRFLGELDDLFDAAATAKGYQES